MAAKVENAKLPQAKTCAKALTTCKTAAQVVAWTKSYMPTLGYKAVGRILVGEPPELAIAGKAERRALKG